MFNHKEIKRVFLSLKNVLSFDDLSLLFFMKNHWLRARAVLPLFDLLKGVVLLLPFSFTENYTLISSCFLAKSWEKLPRIKFTFDFWKIFSQEHQIVPHLLASL